MKVILAILGGLSFSVVTFVGGLVAATVFCSGEGKKQLADTTDLWTNHPVRVDHSKSNLERLPGRAVSPEPTLTTAPTSEPSLPDAGREMVVAAPETSSVVGEDTLAVDATVTGAISLDEATTVPDQTGEPQLSEAHLDWCSSRYRSYRPRDNSYTPYRGGRRECKSPFSPAPRRQLVSAEDNALSPPPTEEDSFAEESAQSVSPQLEQAAVVERSANYGTWEHARSCFARYRSYRPEDNTYQPYGGGPRRQCQ